MRGKSDSTIRVTRRENPFTQIDRSLINDKSLSLDTRMMLIWMLDKPVGWKSTITSLVRQLPAGRSIVRRMINESESSGYIRRNIDRYQGRFVYDYEVSECKFEDELTPPCAVSRRGSADAVQPTRLTAHHSNTVYSNTDQNNTDQPINDDDVSLVSPSSVLVKEVTRASLQRRDHTHAHEATRTNANPSPHLTFCLRIVADLPEWSGAEAFLSNCAEGQLIACASWLHLWNITANYGEYDFQKINEADRQKQLYKVYPFDNVKNIVGKIITQTELCNPAPLVTDHQTSLSAALREIAKGTKP